MANSNVCDNGCCDPPVLLPSSDLTDRVYSMDYQKKGLCLIFSHSEFARSTLKERKGNSNDKNLLEGLFQKLNFDVKIYDDYTEEKIKNILDCVSHLDFSKYGCFVCCFSTHGYSDEDNIFLSAWDEYYLLDDVLSYFHCDSCESLKGKPKIFIIQVCLIDDKNYLDYGQKIICKKNGSNPKPNQSSMKPKQSSSSNQSCNVEKTSEPTDKERFSSIPSKSDFLIISSTYYGFYSYSNKTGSHFIVKLCAKIESNYAEMDLLSILTLVNNDMAYEFESTNRKKQMPFYESSLTKMIKF